ncbi:MAG TPA: hypothetical protein VFF72_05665, partial [Caldimonas sp.]|nr:hypothetical protein [Caldimonas sp.]
MNPDLPRRNLLKAGTASLGGAVMGLQAAAARAQGASTEAGTTVVAVPPLAKASGLRLATCDFGDGGPARIAIVLDGGHVVDVAAQARRVGMKLSFPADSMLAMLASGDGAMAQMRSLAAMVAGGRVATLPMRQVDFHSPIPKPQ